MLPSALEVAFQTMASGFSEYLDDRKGAPVITKDGLNQLVKEQFPHCEKKEIRPGVYEIIIPLNETGPGSSSFDFLENETGPGSSSFDFLENETGPGSSSFRTPENETSPGYSPFEFQGIQADLLLINIELVDRIAILLRGNSN